MPFLVPTRWRGNALATRQRRMMSQNWTLARPEWVISASLRYFVSYAGA